MIAAKWEIPREELDAFSLHSHQLAAAATDSGYFDREIMAVSLADGTSFTRDEGIRRDTTLEKLAALQPSFKPDGVSRRAIAARSAMGRRRCC